MNYNYSYVAHDRKTCIETGMPVPKSSHKLWVHMRLAAKVGKKLEDILIEDYDGYRQELVIHLEKLLMAGWVSVVSGDDWRRNPVKKFERNRRKSIKKELKPMGECVIYDKCISSNGYGRVNRDGKFVYAHRAEWEDTHGPIPMGASVLHRCGKSTCVNVEHLYLGTKSGLPWGTNN